MLKPRPAYIVLYLVAVLLIVFGNRDLWRQLQDASRQREADQRAAVLARAAADKPFEIQKLSLDPATGTWKNPAHYFQPVHVGNVNFKALRSPRKSTSIETNDDEDASDTF